MNATRHAPATPVRILVVDDERDNRELLDIILTREGFVIATAESGKEALAMVALRQPDLILLDVMMPDMTGYEVATKLKANAKTRHIPVVMVTALSDRNARRFAVSAGASYFLTKPVSRFELCTCVRTILHLES